LVVRLTDKLLKMEDVVILIYSVVPELEKHDPPNKRGKIAF